MCIRDSRKAVLINGILIAVLSLPCVFGYNIWSDFRPIPVSYTHLK